MSRASLSIEVAYRGSRRDLRSEDVEAMLRSAGAQVRYLLADLPEIQRHAVVLAYFGDCPLPQVARLLGRPEQIVANEIRSGVDALRDALAGLRSHRLQTSLLQLVPDTRDNVAARAVPVSSRRP